MPLDPKKLEGHSEFDQKLLKIIDDQGWHVMNVVPRAEDSGHAWSYSSGLFYHFKHPEIVIFNESTDLRHSMINSIGDRLKAGETFEPGKGYSDLIGNFDVQLRPMHPSHYWDWLNFACWFYDNAPNTFPCFSVSIRICKANTPGSPDASNGPSTSSHSMISPSQPTELINLLAKTRTYGSGDEAPKGQNY